MVKGMVGLTYVVNFNYCQRCEVLPVQSSTIMYLCVANNSLVQQQQASAEHTALKLVSRRPNDSRVDSIQSRALHAPSPWSTSLLKEGLCMQPQTSAR